MRIQSDTTNRIEAVTMRSPCSIPVRRSSASVSFQSVSPEAIEPSEVMNEATSRKSATRTSAVSPVMRMNRSTATSAV